MNIVIVGGGFAGVKAALELDRLKIGPVTLISDEPYFLHHATLYSTATGGAREESVIPLAEIFAGTKVKLVQDKMTSVDQHRQLVVGRDDHYKYDKLVIAIGSVTTFCGIDGMDEHALGVKSLSDIDKLAAHIRNDIVVDKHLDKNYFVVGGGQTGVELAAALTEYLKYLKHTHRNTKGRVNIKLVERESRLVPMMSETASKRITGRLRHLGVQVQTNRDVERVGDESIIIDGRQVPTETVIWTSGTKNHPFFAKQRHLFHIADNGRVEVDEYLEANTGIYVLGDNNNDPYSGTAACALRQGKFIARHLSHLERGQRPRPFHPRRPIAALPIGRGWGYVEWHGVYVAGRTGYFIRRMLELWNYRQLMPYRKARPIWQAHYLKELDLKRFRK